MLYNGNSPILNAFINLYSPEAIEYADEMITRFNLDAITIKDIVTGNIFSGKESLITHIEFSIKRKMYNIITHEYEDTSEFAFVKNLIRFIIQESEFFPTDEDINSVYNSIFPRKKLKKEIKLNPFDSSLIFIENHDAYYQINSVDDFKNMINKYYDEYPPEVIKYLNLTKKDN